MNENECLMKPLNNAKRWGKVTSARTKGYSCSGTSEGLFWTHRDSETEYLALRDMNTTSYNHTSYHIQAEPKESLNTFMSFQQKYEDPT